MLITQVVVKAHFSMAVGKGAYRIMYGAIDSPSEAGSKEHAQKGGHDGVWPHFHKIQINLGLLICQRAVSSPWKLIIVFESWEIKFELRYNSTQLIAVWLQSTDCALRLKGTVRSQSLFCWWCSFYPWKLCPGLLYKLGNSWSLSFRKRLWICFLPVPADILWPRKVFCHP